MQLDSPKIMPYMTLEMLKSFPLNEEGHFPSNEICARGSLLHCPRVRVGKGKSIERGYSERLRSGIFQRIEVEQEW
jgi:hypothetical protein